MSFKLNASTTGRVVGLQPFKRHSRATRAGPALMLRSTVTPLTLSVRDVPFYPEDLYGETQSALFTFWQLRLAEKSVA
jgi:hypothetical protein